MSQILTTSIGVSNSPEFEFCSSFSPSDQLSADELFSGGILLPLHHLRLSNDTPPPAQDLESSGSYRTRQETEPKVPTSGSAAQSTPAAAGTLSFSRRWSDIFRRNEKKSPRASLDMDAEDLTVTREKKDHMVFNGFKEKKREKKKNGGGSAGGTGATAAELNINIWPFSRSSSAGNGASRPRPAAPVVRKSISAPCSRSNSISESKSRRRPTSPGRGVHVGRSSPVWQVRRGGRRSFEAVVRRDGTEGRRKASLPFPGGGAHSRAKSLSLNIPTCTGYKRQHPACGSTESVAGGVRGSSFFNIKSLFTKKVH